MNQEDRIRALQGVLEKGQGLVLTEYRHRVFLLRFPSSAGTIFLTAQKRWFIVDFRYIEAARQMKNYGFQILLQTDLAQQLQALAREAKVREILTDTESLTAEGFESLCGLFPEGVFSGADRVSQYLSAVRTQRTEEEEGYLRRAEEIGSHVLGRFQNYVTCGASPELLRRKLTQLRGEAGDESRTFEARLLRKAGEGWESLDTPLRRGERISVEFSVTAGLLSKEVRREFCTEALLPVPVKERLSYLRELPAEENDAVLLSGNANIRYYLGTRAEAGSWLLVTHTEVCLFAEKRPAGCGAVTFIEKRGWKPAMERILHTEKIAEILTERSVPLPVLRQWRELPWRVEPSETLEARIYRRRGVKAQEELQRIRAAQRITDRVFLESLNYIRAGMTDVEIQRMVGMLFYDMGSEMDSFNHVCGCGADTSCPHVKPSGRIAQPGDFVMLDIGAQVDGYGSDMTRMVGIREVDEEKKRIYDLVLKAQTSAIRAAQKGAVCSDVDGVARSIIAGEGFGDCFLHGLGHPIGCGGREGPRFNQTDGSILAPGVVMTVEPGIYLPGKFGVRIEDMVYIGETETENLTHSPKNLICV